LEKVECNDCEIVIITDGGDNQLSGNFLGLTGFDALMMNLKARQRPLPRVFVFCVSKDCEDEIGRRYKELTLGLGGQFCDDSNLDECSNILNQPNAVCLKLKRYFQQEYRDLLEQGQVRLLPWITKDAL
jgi:hypothetical protein